MRKRIFLLSLMLLCLPAGPSTVLADSDVLMIGDFSGQGLQGWEDLAFVGTTEYRLVEMEQSRLLRADSSESASGLVKKIRIDLQEYPFLNWSWKVAEPLKIQDESKKQGDDFAARIYVIVQEGWLPWDKRAVNYVWASASVKGKVWPNPYVGEKAMMMAVRSRGDLGLGMFQEKRNLRDDLKQLFGRDIRFIDAVAIMTDSDDSNQRAVALYGNIYFSRQ